LLNVQILYRATSWECFLLIVLLCFECIAPWSLLTLLASSPSGFHFCAVHLFTYTHLLQAVPINITLDGSKARSLHTIPRVFKFMNVRGDRAPENIQQSLRVILQSMRALSNILSGLSINCDSLDPFFVVGDWSRLRRT
jgi:hypothetical protein